MIEEAKRWLLKALDDLKVAEHEMALPANERVTSAVCFHLQQFVEKVFKAFLVAHGRSFPRTHNLSFLKMLCAEIDKDFAALPVDELSIYAVEMRYPGEPLRPSQEECEAFLRLAQAIKALIEVKIGVKLDELAHET